MKSTVRYVSALALVVLAACSGAPDERIGLLADGAKLYRGVSDLRTGEVTTVAGHRMIRLESSQAGSMEALRNRFRPIFTERAIDTIITDLGIVEHGGKLWMPEGDSGDILVYEDADILDSQDAGNATVLKLEIPLGDSGQTDVRTLRLMRVGEEWRIDNNPYRADSNPDNSAEDDSTDDDTTF